MTRRIAFGILIVLILLLACVGLGSLLNKFLGTAWIFWANLIFVLSIAFVVGLIAFFIIYPDKKRGQLASRITVLVALLAYLWTVMAAIFPHLPEFSASWFLLEGVLVGAITMAIIYGIAQVIHWAIKGTWM